jgi:SRSO17 transposase
MPHFTRRAARHRAWAYIRGLLSPGERKNGWQLVQVNGDATPDGVQHLLGRARGDAEAVRDALRASLVEPISDPRAVLVLDETGLLKKGQQSAGVARQYSGTAGRVEKCQMGVLLGSARRDSQALLDCALYLPQAWTNDSERCERAGVPEKQPFATQPQRARQLLTRAFDARVPMAWVTGDSCSDSQTSRRLRPNIVLTPLTFGENIAPVVLTISENGLTFG